MVFKFIQHKKGKSTLDFFYKKLSYKQLFSIL